MPAIQVLILRNLIAGVPGETAAQAAGVGPSTFYAWKARGERQPRGRYREFLEAIKKAEAEIEVNCAAIVLQAMPTTWQSAAWWLERRHPERWGRRDRVDLVLRETAERIAGMLDGISASELIDEAQRMVTEHDF